MEDKPLRLKLRRRIDMEWYWMILLSAVVIIHFFYLGAIVNKLKILTNQGEFIAKKHGG